MKAIDVQSFAGGFTLGMKRAGFDIVAKRELPGGFAAPSCAANKKLLGDYEYEEGPWEEWTPRDVDVVFGNPPCSGFSNLSNPDFRGPDSPINSCMWALVEYAVKCSPKIIMFESVQPAFGIGLPLMRALRDRAEERTGKQWHLHHVLHNAMSVGGPSIRRRYFWLISQVPFGVETYPLENLPMLNDVIGDLRGLTNTIDAQAYSPSHEPSWWVKGHDLRNAAGTVDGHVQLDNPHVRRIQYLLSKSRWDEGEILADVAGRVWNEHGGRWPDLDDDVMDRWAEKEFRLGFNQVIRWRGQRPARVITGAAAHNVIHPVEDRLITLREMYRIQGFPDAWELKPAVEMVSSANQAMAWPGKGIPVQVGEWIGEWVKRALNGEPGAYRGDEYGERESVIDTTNDWKRLYSERTHKFENGMNKQVMEKFNNRPA